MMLGTTALLSASPAVALTDGTSVTLRPLTWGDAIPVRQVFDAMSPESRRLRFLTAVPRLSPRMERLLVAVDHERHGAWVAERDGVAVGIGRWFRLRDEPQAAEIALSVVDALHGRGLGRALVAVLGVAASERGITQLSWTMDVENRRALRLAAPYAGTRSVSSGVVEARTALPDPVDVDVDAVRRLAREVRTGPSVAA